MPVDDDLLAELLAKPIGPEMPGRTVQPEDFTQEIEVLRSGSGPIQVNGVISGDAGTVTEGTARSFIEEEGLDPAEWEIANWRKSRWGNPENPMESVRFSFRRRQAAEDAAEWVEEALAALVDHEAVEVRPTGSHGFLILLGDMQFGKIDGDGVKGTLQRTIDCLNKAADTLLMYRRLFDIGHVHIAWLGDHIEGFVSQGGANVWRTNLPLNEQIRLTRRVMLHALKVFAPLATTVTMAAVPGNHGEPVRFQGTGLTRYDDSHDTEALIAVSDAAEMLPEAFGHVRFFVPDTDELIVVTDVAGTTVAHAHGHKHRVGKHFEWWKGQAFNRDSAMHVADLLVEGHLHHEHIEADGDRLFIQVPSMESESTWFKHTSGTGGNPGLVVAITKDGRTPIKHTIN
jgi:hypothetical protein